MIFVFIFIYLLIDNLIILFKNNIYILLKITKIKTKYMNIKTKSV